MPLRIVRNDITKIKADAIVNSANPLPRFAGGSDSAIYKAAGANQLLMERTKIGEIPVGRAAATSAFALDAKYIIHTVGPCWEDGAHGEPEALRSCYMQSLALARELGCESIAFPLISSGTYGFPKDLAIRTATSAIYDFLMENDMMIFLVVFDRASFELSGKLFEDIKAYVDENYVEGQEAEEYSLYEERRLRARRDRAAGSAGLLTNDPGSAPGLRTNGPASSAILMGSGRGSSFFTPAKKKEASLDEWLLGMDEDFCTYLNKLLAESNMTNPEVYNRAGLTKQAFSKIISNKVHPTKNSVCALALALRLDLDTANELLFKAGMVLSKSSKFDMMIRFFLEYRIYDMATVSEILFDAGYPPLGSKQ